MIGIQPSDVVNHLHEWYCERKSAGTPPSPNGVIGGSMRDRTRAQASTTTRVGRPSAAMVRSTKYCLMRALQSSACLHELPLRG